MDLFFDQIEEVDRMKRIWLPVGAYEQLERIAEERGATPDEALTQIILKNVKR